MKYGNSSLQLLIEIIIIFYSYCLLDSIVYYTSIISAEVLLRLSSMSGTPRTVS